MRRVIHVTVACAAMTALVLAGCSADDEGSASASGGPTVTATPSPDELAPDSSLSADHEADVVALAGVTLTGNLGTMPFFNVASPITLTGEVAREADEGTGRLVEAGHALAVHVASFNAKTEIIEGSSYEEESGPELLLVDQTSLPPVLFDAFVGARVGSRVLFGAPLDGVTTIYAFEILATAPIFDHAEGAEVIPQPGLPAVTFSDDGVPTMTPVAGDPPGSLVTQPLITGEGDPIGAESWLVVSFSTWLWNGTELASTWEDGHPTVLRMADAVAGWQVGLEGKPIGSRVMLVVPPAEGYGDEATEGIPAGSTLVYVVDILAGM